MGSVNSYRTYKPPVPNTPGAASGLKNTMFAVRVAYASYLPQKDSLIPA